MSYQQALAAYKILQHRELQEKDIDQLVENYHPDYYTDAGVTLQAGVNKGERCHQKLADILQSTPLINAADLTACEIIETDILVIGGGGAGCAAALVAAECGAQVTIATKLRSGDSNTVMAEGGVQVSIEDSDSPQKHFDDTIKSANRAVNKELVAGMVKSAPEVVHWLIKQGMQFEQDGAGNLLTRKAGGTQEPRVAYFKDYTGLEMMRVLKESISSSAVKVMDYSPVVELTSDEKGSCSGAVVRSLQDRKYQLIRAKAVILATGGIGRLHLNGFPTSNHFGATGDGLVLAYRMGAKLRDIDSFQYHPSGLAHPYHLSGMLITEGIRSAGAYLLNARGERFIDELRPRDQVSSAILRECAEGRGISDGHGVKGVWLDTPGLEQNQPGILQQRFPKLLKLGAKCKIDPILQPLLIYPTLHYQNGGVIINEHGESQVKGLYCIGEITGGIHGRNRLMGNSLLEIICFGRRAGAHAAELAANSRYSANTLEHVNVLQQALQRAGHKSNECCPVLFPDYAKFNLDADFSGANKNTQGKA